MFHAYRSSKGGLFDAFELSSMARSSPIVTGTAAADRSNGTNARLLGGAKTGSVGAHDWAASSVCGSPIAFVDQRERTRSSTVCGSFSTRTSMLDSVPLIPTVNVWICVLSLATAKELGEFPGLNCWSITGVACAVAAYSKHPISGVLRTSECIFASLPFLNSDVDSRVAFPTNRLGCRDERLPQRRSART